MVIHCIYIFLQTASDVIPYSMACILFFLFFPGNEFMKIDKYEEAIECYDKAIEINPANAVYFCNR